MGVNRRSEIKMTSQEVEGFLRAGRTTTMCSMHPDGSIHAVAMWYALLDGAITVETKGKSQKVRNLRRDPRVTFLVEEGDRYEELRGVEVVGRACIIDDPDTIWAFGVEIWSKYIAAYDESQRSELEAMMRNRVLVSVEADKVVSWDHRKLGATAAR